MIKPFDLTLPKDEDYMNAETLYVPRLGYKVSINKLQRLFFEEIDFNQATKEAWLNTKKTEIGSSIVQGLLNQTYETARELPLYKSLDKDSYGTTTLKDFYKFLTFYDSRDSELKFKYGAICCSMNGEDHCFIDIESFNSIENSFSCMKSHGEDVFSRLL